jgi:hypothetical protein
MSWLKRLYCALKRAYDWLMKSDQTSQNEFDALLQLEQASYDQYSQTEEGKLAYKVWSATVKDVVMADEMEIFFYAYHTQVGASAMLALTSLFRQHGVQSYAMLRNASENICNALFGLLDRDNVLANFKKEDAVKRAESDEVYKKAAYKWMDANHAEYSKYLNDMKKTFFHAVGAHASIYGVVQNLTIKDKTFKVSYLDTTAPEMLITNILFAAEFLLKYLEFVVEHAAEAKLAIPDDLPARVKAFRTELERLREKNRPIFLAFQQNLVKRK